MPLFITKGLKAEHVLLALADLDAGTGHPFGSSTGYEVVHEGKRYALEAVVGIAFRYLDGDLLPPEAVSGGEAPGQANHVLRGLGFTIEKQGDGAEPEGRTDWSEEEVSLIVADYFNMLRLDLADRPFSKAEHNRLLRESLRVRSKGSVEFKHQNISAVLLERGMPYLDGYKPARNYQRRILPEAIDDYLAAHPEIHKLIESSPVLNPTATPELTSSDVLGYFDAPPDRMTSSVGDSKPWLSRKGRKIDYTRRDAVNRELGRLGEQFTMQIEKRRLMEAGRDDLAAKVEWVSDTCGDGVGFDVLSFDHRDDSELYLEVKTTGLGKYFPFVVTGNELRCSEDLGEQFHLYRVFDFARRPRVYVLPGPLTRSCMVEPLTYRAWVMGE